jgi:hypothetical protein
MINRPLKAGAQLFDNYGFHHCLETIRERQNALKSQYVFECKCLACVDNYPLYPKLKSATNDFYQKIGMDFEKLLALDYEVASTRFKDYCKMIDKLDRFYPCYEVSSLQEILLRCSSIFKCSKFNLLVN